MSVKTSFNKNRAANILIKVLFIGWFLSLPFSLQAEDYPSIYLEPGYREYIAEKVQNGFYVETFTRIDLQQKERVNKRNQVEQLLTYSSEVMPETANNVSYAEAEYKYYANTLKAEVINLKNQRHQVASAQGVFNYLPHSDGQIDYFKDGLIDHIENERVIDEFGNVAIQNTYDMQYNDKRLLVSYKSDTKDNLGNIKRTEWYGAKYTPDSIFYGGAKTNANRNISEYIMKEIDAAGNVTLTTFKALDFEGKFLRAFNQKIEDSIYGNQEFTRSNIKYENNNPQRICSYHEEGKGTDNLAYTLDRNNIKYSEKDAISAYHEETTQTQIDGLKVTSTLDAQFTYLGVDKQFGRDVEAGPDRILESVVSTSTVNPDGSTKTETNTNKYSYGQNQKLKDASGESAFNGKEASGNTFSGTSKNKFEILFGKPMNLQSDSSVSYFGAEDNKLYKTETTTTTYTNKLVNNLLKTFSAHESSKTTYPLLDPDNSHLGIEDILTEYIYDKKGGLADAQASGTEEGYEYSSERGWTSPYTSKTVFGYDVVQGRALMKTIDEEKIDKPASQTGATLTTTSTSSSHSEYSYNDYGVNLSVTETTTSKTTTTNASGQYSKTTTTLTAKSVWKGGNFKIESLAKESDTTASDGSSAHNTSTTAYEYNELGKLKGASGKTQTSGKNADDAGTYTSNTIDSYNIKNGQALLSGSTTTGANYAADGSKTYDSTQTVAYEYILVGGNWEISSETTTIKYTYAIGGSQSITKTKSYQRNANGVCTGISQTATGSYTAVNSLGGTATYEMQNYSASFTSDAQLGWYLQKESYDWKQSNDVIHSEYVYENHGIAISAIEKTTTTTTLADGDGTSTTTTTSTDTSAWKGGNLKIESSAKTSKSSKADGSSSTSTSTTTYEYNELGKLKGASGKTETTGTNKGGGTYTSSSINSYIIKNGQALPSKSTTTGSVKGTTDEKNSNFSETTTYEYQLIAGNWQLVKEISVSRSNGTNDSTETITRTKIYSRNTKGVCTGITQTATGSAGIGRWGFTLQSYNAEFALDAKAGWYLKQESYSWQWQG